MGIYKFFGKKPLVMKLTGGLIGLLILWGIILSAFFVVNARNTFLKTSEELINKSERELAIITSEGIENTKKLLLDTSIYLTNRQKQELDDIPFDLYRGDEARIKKVIAESGLELKERADRSFIILSKVMEEQTSKRVEGEIQKLRNYQIRQSRILARKMQLGLAIFVFLGILLLVFIMSFWINKIVMRPIRRLVEGTQKVAEGDLTSRVKVESADELGQLATSFNKMTKDLNTSRDKIIAARDYTNNIVTSMIDSLIVVGPDGKIKTINKATSDLLGYEEDELIEKPVAAILEEEETEGEEITLFQSARMKKLIREGSIRDYNMTYRTKSGQKIPVAFSGSVMRETHPSLDGEAYEAGVELETDLQRKIVGIVGIARDMRDIRNMQAMLVQSEKLSSLGQLGAGIAHELNSPLTGLLMLIRSYKKEKDPNTEEYQDLKEMQEACEHMAKIIRDLNDFTRVSTEDMVELNCNEVIETTLGFSAHELNKKGIRLEKLFDENIPLVRGNKSQLQQVVINMITNAGDAISGKGIFKITTRSVTTDNGTFVQMIFSDTGCGISKDMLGNIFDPFFTTKRPGRGIGLGLSITYTIIKNHNGEILVDSEPGRGTEFTIILLAA